jgi:hypothetical protein
VSNMKMKTPSVILANRVFAIELLVTKPPLAFSHSSSTTSSRIQQRIRRHKKRLTELLAMQVSRWST